MPLPSPHTANPPFLPPRPPARMKPVVSTSVQVESPAKERTGGRSRAAVEIDKYNGRIVVDEHNPDKPVVEVNLASTEAPDSVVVCVKEYGQLQRLNLGETKVTDAGLEELQGLTQLRVLLLGA